MILMLTSIHRRAVATLTRERDEARALVERRAANNRALAADATRLVDENRALRRQLADVTGQLAVFTGPRRRDAKGHFIKGTK